MKYQQGSTLIMVLIVLLLITLIGTMAMRESLLNLRLSTTTQVGNVLLSTNDAALFEIENPNRVRVRLASQNMYGYFDDDLNAEDELVFCYDAQRTAIFELRKTSVINSGKLGTNGYCSKTQFSTGRKGAISQIYLRKLTSEGDEVLAAQILNNEIATGKSAGAKLNLAATTVSVLPGLSTKSFDDIAKCFKLSAKKTTASTKNDNVEMCLQELNVPYNLQYAEFDVEASPKNVKL